MNNSVDFRNFKFKQLESFEDMEFDTYCGPTPESNWVLPDLLLVGVLP